MRSSSQFCFLFFVSSFYLNYCWLSISWWLQWVFVEISLTVCQPVHSLNLPHAILLILYILHQRRSYRLFFQQMARNSDIPFTLWSFSPFIMSRLTLRYLCILFSLIFSPLSSTWGPRLGGGSLLSGPDSGVLWLGWLVWLDMIDFITVNTPNNYPDTTSTTFHSLIMNTTWW